MGNELLDALTPIGHIPRNPRSSFGVKSAKFADLRLSGRTRFPLQGFVEQGFDHHLVTHAAALRDLAGALQIRYGQPDGDVLGGDGAAAAMFHQEIGDQLLVLVPPFGLLGFRAEAGRVHGDFGSFG